MNTNIAIWIANGSLAHIDLDDRVLQIGACALHLDCGI
jgi:hypothetical protein